MKAKNIATENGFNWTELCSFIEKKSGIKHKFTMTDTVIDDADVPVLVEMYKAYLKTPEETQPAAEAQHVDAAMSYYSSNTSSFSLASGKDLPYVVLQVTLKEKFFGTGSGNLEELEEVINYYASKGYRLHTMATSNGGSKGGFGGDRIQATLVFEKKDF